jgi:hypothetical protein
MFESSSESSPTQSDSSQSSAGPPFSLATTSERFITWQIQFGLIPSASNSWFSDWQNYYRTYTALLSGNNLDADPILARHVHIDVVRLSRYAGLFGTESAAHFQRMERALCVFARFSAANGYRQAFHELFFPLYFVAVTGGLAFNLELDVCEAISFFLFHALINGTVIGDFFLSDTTESPLTKIADDAFAMLHDSDPVLHRHMEESEISPLLFAFSWLSVLFSQIYPIDSLLKLWDFLFQDVKEIPETLTCLVVAHLIKLRGRLLGKTFPHVMEVLHDLVFESESEPVLLCKRIQQRSQIVSP